MGIQRHHDWKPGLRRAGLAFAAAGLLALLAPTARAGDGTKVGPFTLTGDAEFGGRQTWTSGDTSVFDNYRDLSTGLFGNFQLQLEDATHKHFLEGSGWNIGYDNQRYDVEMGRWGRYKLDFFYGELPVVFSKGASSLFVSSNSNTLLLPAGVQSAIESAGAGGTAARAAALQAALGGAQSTDVGFRWLEGGAKGDIHLGENLDFHASYRIQDKEGSRPFSMAMGFFFPPPGVNFNQLPAPINEKIHTIDAGVDWLFHGVALRFAYDGSLFVNDYDSVTAANPLFATNSTGGSSLGRSSLAPDNQAHSFSLSASASLPFNFSNRVTSSFVYQLRYQDARFIPVTINPALATTPPTQSSLNGWVDAYVGNLVATARPTKNLGLKFRYHMYDYNNRSDSVVISSSVVNDTSVDNTTAYQSTHESFQRQDAELSGDYSFTSKVTGTLGLNWEHWNRSSDREVHSLDDYGPTAKLDWRPFTGGVFRLDYSYRKRQGADYGTFNYLYKQQGIAFDDTGQSVLLRKFTQADRDSNKIGVMARFLPTEATELTFNGSYDLEDYNNSDLGLVQTQTWDAGADFAWQVSSWMRMTAFYTYENSFWKQDQRWRNVVGVAAVDNPINNWFSNTLDRYHNAGFRVDFDIIPEKLDAEIGYVFNYGRSQQHGSGVAGQDPTTGADGGNAVDWPTITSKLHAVTTTLSYHFSKRLTVKLQYRYENYSISNFTQSNAIYQPGDTVDGSGGSVGPPPTSLNVYLGDGVKDYQANIVGLSAILHF